MNQSSPKNRIQPRAVRLTESLLKRPTPAFSAWHIPEPKLLFHNSQYCEDPKTGITLFGPKARDNAPRNSIRVGVVGTGETIQLVKNWIDLAKYPIMAGLNKKGKPYDSILFPDFPGFSFETMFACEASLLDKHILSLTEKEVERAIAHDSAQERIRNMVKLVVEKLQVLNDKEPQPDVVIVAMPKSVEDACGSKVISENKTRAITKLEKRERRMIVELRKYGQQMLGFMTENEYGESSLMHYKDFHDSLKANAMCHKLPTQLVWYSTLTNKSNTEDPATTAWNFFTALYYKSGNMPWELRFATQRTCFVGISFYRTEETGEYVTRTSLAQAFSESGEGIVLRGEPVTWDLERDKKPHLSREAAENLLRRVLRSYDSHLGGMPSRVVLHKTSRYWPEELAGFKAALDGVHSFDFLAIERRGIRFLRLGHEPPIRGTVVQLGSRNYLIYSRGYIPFYKMYPGQRIPNPIEVVEHHGDSSPDKVCSEILALTKLNWNSCSYGSAFPITIAFAKQVATIMKEMPNDVEPETKYRYFM
jgi:hypothetical protein